MATVVESPAYVLEYPVYLICRQPLGCGLGGKAWEQRPAVVQQPGLRAIPSYFYMGLFL